jgi:hypothetical protein
MAKTRWLALGALGLVLVAAIDAGAQNASVLHEFIPPDPHEDVSFATTTIEGDLPAAIQTPSGVATAPDPRKPPGEHHTYGGATTDDSPDATYEPDRDTRRPKVETYDDPFSPATAPFKRLRAYDTVAPDYTLKVDDKNLQTLPVGGTLNAGEEPFYGDLSIDLLPEEPVRIPTVGPGARVLRMHTNPEVPTTLLRDGADNWFIRGKTRVRVRLVIEIAISRATFGSDFPDVDWPELARTTPKQPHEHDAPANEVAQAIGVSHQQRPRDVLRKLVEYFRAFAPSEDKPTGHGDIYRDLALSKKGVCRHRSFAFLVTALHLGFPARMVVNEAHAWVEVSDGSLWHRIDLGGAASNLDSQNENERPPYVPPPDPYSWPESRDSGQDLADRSRGGGNAPGNGSGDADGGAAAPSLSPTASAPRQSSGPDSDVSVTSIDNDARRGMPFHVQGQILDAGAPCAHVRVDLLLVGQGSPQGAALGSLSTDDRGVYDGAIVIPRDFSLGDYELVVVTPGDARCAPGRTR